VAWVYYAAQIFLLGAEFTKVYADSHGSLSGRKAQQSTEAAARIKDEGVGAVAAVGAALSTRPDDAGELARIAQAHQDAERRLARAREELAERLLLLGGLALADYLASRWIRRRRRRRPAAISRAAAGDGRR
jgi:membrane protein